MLTRRQVSADCGIAVKKIGMIQGIQESYFYQRIYAAAQSTHS